MTDAQAREIAAAEAGAVGEELVWWGRPDAGRAALRSLPLSLFGVPFAGFAAFWMAAASSFRWPDLTRGGFALFPLFGTPFLAVGLGFVLAPAFAWRSARRTLYAASASGVWIVTAGRTRKVERHAIEDARELRASVRRDGSGDLVVGRRTVPGRNGQLRLQEVTLVGIPEVRRVERIVASIARPALAAQMGPGAPALGGAGERPAIAGAQPPPARFLAAAVTLAIVVALVAGALRVYGGRARVTGGARVAAAQAPAPPSATPPSATPPPAATPPVAAPPIPTAAASPPTAARGSETADVALPPPPVTFASYRELCDGGDGAACTRAGLDLAKGADGPPDPRTAARLLARGCELANGVACQRLGWMLQRGDGIPADRRAGAGWLVRACELGSMEGCRSAGFALAYGDGVPADPRRAMPMLERACAAQGYPRACAALGDVLEKASPPDAARALEAFRRGCAQRDGDCCDRAARLGR